MNVIRGVLLDVDGTLVDSNDAHAQAWVDALAKHDFYVSFDEVRPLIGMGGDKLLQKVGGIESESPVGKAVSEDRLGIFLREYLPHLEPCPGARELVRELKSRGFRLVVASSATDAELKPLLRLCGTSDLITAKTSSDDADRSKPDPDIIHVALEKVELPASQVILLGDTPYDLEAAARAGVAAIALRCGGWSDDDLQVAEAIYDDPADLLWHLDQSPLESPLVVDESAAESIMYFR